MENPRVAVVNLSDLVGGRLDVKFVLLHETHKAAAKELAEKFSREELIDLAKELPFNQRAAEAVWPSAWLLFRKELETKDAKDGFPRPKALLKVRMTDLIAYVAAACQHAIGKQLLELKALKLQELAMLKKMSGLLGKINAKDAQAVIRSMKGELEVAAKEIE